MFVCSVAGLAQWRAIDFRVASGGKKCPPADQLSEVSLGGQLENAVCAQHENSLFLLGRQILLLLSHCKSRDHQKQLGRLCASGAPLASQILCNKFALPLSPMAANGPLSPALVSILSSTPARNLWAGSAHVSHAQPLGACHWGAVASLRVGELERLPVGELQVTSRASSWTPAPSRCGSTGAPPKRRRPSAREGLPLAAGARAREREHAALK